MEHPGFFHRQGPFALREIAARIGATLSDGADPERRLVDIRPLSEAGPDDLTFIDNPKYLPQLAGSGAGACITAPANVARVPAGIPCLVMRAPYRGFALSLQLFYPDAMTPKAAGFAAGEGGGGPVHASARLEDGVVIEPGAVVGREAIIGRGTTVAAGAVVGYRVAIGRGCYIGAGATVTHALVGDRVILHAGVRIGQDGFGFAMGPDGHLKVPQIGRVIIQDDVEIGANSTVDRGALKDTVIGEGTKIDNLVQIGHNVTIGRRCVIVAQTGIAGSTVLEDFVIMGGQSGAAGHLRIGAAARVAGGSHVVGDVPAGARFIGTPAVPMRQWTKEAMTLRRLAKSKPGAAGGSDDGGAP